MKVVKRDGKIVDFDEERIRIAISKANKDVEKNEEATQEEIEAIVDYVKSLKKKRMLVEDIQDLIENKLMEYKRFNLARTYITYRYNRALVRKANTTDQTIKELIDGTSDYWNTENSNKNAKIVTTQSDYLAGITTTLHKMH